MPIDFPNSPTSGQTFTVGAITWQWDGSVWKALGSSNPGRDYVSATAPSSPAEGARWLNSNDLKTYTYYDSQWIESNSNLKGETGSQGAPAGNNVIINGAFDFWQRGTSATSGGYSAADRWRYDNVGGTYTISKQTFTPGTAPVSGYEAEAFYRLNLTSASGYQAISQRIEDVRTLAGQTATLSFWAKTGSANSIAVYLDQNFGSGGSTEVTTTLNAAQALTTGWVRYTFTVAVPSISGKAVGSSSYLQVRIPVGTATTYDLWGVQLEAGSVATPFRRNGANPQAELAACQRYYQRYYAGTIYGFFPGIYGTSSATNGAGTINLVTQLRTTPQSIDYGGSLRITLPNDAALLFSGITLNTAAGGVNVLCFNGTHTGATGNTFYRIQASNDLNAYIGVGAEI